MTGRIAAYYADAFRKAGGTSVGADGRGGMDGSKLRTLDGFTALKDTTAATFGFSPVFHN